MAQLINILREKWVAIETPNISLEEKTVLITGTNAGLGLEAAKKLADLRPKRLIITTRSISKGEQTLKAIQTHIQATGSATKMEIIPLVLDMGTLDGVESFVQTLRQTVDRLDGAILNAGINLPYYQISGDGYEDTLQVNTISTIYLAVLILPLLMSTAKANNTQTHLTFVSSRTAVGTNATPLAPFLSSDTPMKVMSEAGNFPPGFLGGQTRYGQSKLFLEYAMRGLVQSPPLKDKDGRPFVIINSVCPGVCGSDLARNYPWGIQLFAKYTIIPLLAKPAEKGAVCYLRVYAKSDESYGKLSAAGDSYIETWPALSSDTGKQFATKAWAELIQLMQSRNNSSIAEVLGPIA